MKPLQALALQPLSASIFDQLLGRIVDGEMPPGSALPSERALCASFGVNRTAVREALKRLQQANVISVRQGGATRVLDPRRSAGLDLLVAMVFDGEGRLREGIVRSLVEVVSLIGPEIARLSAEHRAAADVIVIEEIISRMEALGRDDYVNLQRQHLELWRVLVAASGNLVFQLMFNSMERAWGELQDTLAFVLADEITDLDGYRNLVAAIANSDGPAAADAATLLVEKGARALLVAAEKLQEAR